jgi:hypothetical protein
MARQGLRDLGYVEDQTIAFDVRGAGGRPEAFPGLVADLVRRKVDVIFAAGPAAIRAARSATSTIPIVALDLESNPVQAVRRPGLPETERDMLWPAHSPGATRGSGDGR